MLPDGDTRFPKRKINAIEVAFSTRRARAVRPVGRIHRSSNGLGQPHRPSERRRGSSPSCSRSGCCHLQLRSSTRWTSTSKHSIRLRTARPPNRRCTRPQRPSKDEADDTDNVSGFEQEALALAAAALPDVDREQEETLLARMRARAVNFGAAETILEEMRGPSRRPLAQSRRQDEEAHGLDRGNLLSRRRMER